MPGTTRFLRRQPGDALSDQSLSSWSEGSWSESDQLADHDLELLEDFQVSQESVELPQPLPQLEDLLDLPQ